MKLCLEKDWRDQIYKPLHLLPCIEIKLLKKITQVIHDNYGKSENTDFKKSIIFLLETVNHMTCPLCLYTSLSTL